MLFDAHCHLQDPTLSRDLPGVLKRAESAGVCRLACCATRQEEWATVLGIARDHPAVFPMLGIHPWHATTKLNEQIPELEKVLRRTPAAGIGETGLDFRRQFSNRAAQEAGLIAHLGLARCLDRPIAVHCVHAWGRMMELLREDPAPRILLHAYGGSVELIDELVGLNAWFSFGAAVMNPGAKRIRAAVVAVPRERLLLETDSPDMPPPGHPPPNEPARLPAVLECIAALREEEPDVLAKALWRNAHTFEG